MRNLVDKWALIRRDAFKQESCHGLHEVMATILSVIIHAISLRCCNAVYILIQIYFKCVVRVYYSPPGILTVKIRLSNPILILFRYIVKRRLAFATIQWRSESSVNEIFKISYFLFIFFFLFFSVDLDISRSTEIFFFLKFFSFFEIFWREDATGFLILWIGGKPLPSFDNITE